MAEVSGEDQLILVSRINRADVNIILCLFCDPLS